MKLFSSPPLRRLAATLLVTACYAIATRASAGQYTNFTTAVYISVGVLLGLQNPQQLASDWERIHAQLKVDKVYIEVQRDRTIASDQLITQVKSFFTQRGVSVAGGMALSDGGWGQFRSFCYTEPVDRAFIKRAVECAAKHFDEVIQDDFFFVTTKFDSDIAAKGDRSWTQFRLDLMNEASESLLLKPARAVNPKVKMVIKFPNWYEHFHGSGFDLDKQPRLFDGIYTGTETRDPEITDQNLQQYESYQIIRYFENIKPGGNGGGWVDSFSVRYVDRYAEQLWNTLFAKTPEITLFEWSALTRPIVAGERAAWEKLPTSFNLAELRAAWKTNAPASVPQPTIARAAGYSIEQADAFLGKLGQPIGIASYRPPHAWGEDFLHNYFGVIGIPIDLHPTFPTNANTVLLTEVASFDAEIVAKINGQLREAFGITDDLCPFRPRATVTVQCHALNPKANTALLELGGTVADAHGLQVGEQWAGLRECRKDFFNLFAEPNLRRLLAAPARLHPNEADNPRASPRPRPASVPSRIAMRPSATRVGRVPSVLDSVPAPQSCNARPK